MFFTVEPQQPIGSLGNMYWSGLKIQNKQIKQALVKGIGWIAHAYKWMFWLEQLAVIQLSAFLIFVALSKF